MSDFPSLLKKKWENFYTYAKLWENSKQLWKQQHSPEEDVAKVCLVPENVKPSFFF